MRTVTKIFDVILIILLLQGCKKDKAPVITTSSISNITGTTATSGGSITDEGSGTVLSRGICYSIGPTPSITDYKTTDGAGAGTFTSNLTGLKGATTYFLRAYAINSAGTGYGMVMSFTTLGQVPTVVTLAATGITANAAQLNGSVDANYLSSDVSFEYGTTINYGSTVAANQTPVTGSDITSVNGNITGLTDETLYHYRIKASNSIGTTFGDDMTFTITNILNDLDGNSYTIVQIGTQFWMGENLKSTKFNDNSAIPLVTDDASWMTLTTPGYCWYNNDESTNKTSYGGLYNFYSVNTGKLCPAGWHVPSDNDFIILADFLGGASVAGGKMKEEGTVHWSSPNTGATNESNFTALPGGQRDESGAFIGMSLNGIWWSSTPYNDIKPWYRSLGSTISTLYSGNGSLNIRGFSIRCLRD